MNLNPSPTVTCSALPSSFVLLISDAPLLSDGSALLSSPTSSSAILYGVTDPMIHEPF
jgi:hypothetical protein